MIESYVKDLFPFRLVTLAALGIGTVLLMVGCKGGSPGNPNLREGRLSGCPASPNCVSTESSGDKHAIAPLSFTSSPGNALQCLKRIITSMKRVTIVQADADYIHAEFRTLLGFVDDVEFLVDEGKHMVQMRSASTLGYWDFGVNRHRLEAIRAKFEQECT
jgi:uncharacterized protein (DUF1499 family)